MSADGAGESVKRASYRAAVDWIAQNDSAADDDADDFETGAYLGYSALVAGTFDVEHEKAGRHVANRRKALGYFQSNGVVRTMRTSS